MRKRAALSAACFAVALSVLGPIAVLPASAAFAAEPGTQNLATDRVWVQYLAKYDPRSTVRIGAWQALLSSEPEAAIAQFVASGYDYAVKLAADKKSRNADFAKRVLAA